MSPRQREHPPTPPGVRRVALLSLALSGLAVVLAAGALGTVVLRGPEAGCGPLAWNAIPDPHALPAGWSMVTNRVFLDNLTTTLLGPVPSGATQPTAVLVSLSCYGGDGALAFRRAHDGALAVGASDIATASLGDESFGVQSPTAGSATIYVRRAGMVAEVAAPASVDIQTLTTLARVVDRAMARSLSADASAIGAPVPPRSPAPPAGTPSGNPVPATAGPGQSPAAEHHVSPDLEAVLPHAVGTTTFTTQSILGTDAIKSDPASQALVASLTKLDRTPADLEIAEAQDPTGTFKAYLFAYRVKGVGPAALDAAIIDSLTAGQSAAPVRSQLTLAGHVVTKLAYGSGSSVYLYEQATDVLAIETPDESLASLVLALVK